MSQENLALIRSVYDAVNRRDFDFAETLTAEDFEIESAITNQTYRGRNAPRRNFEDLLDAFGEFQMVIEEMIDRGDQVVVLFRIEAVGRGSGVRLGHPAAQVWTVRNEQAVRNKSYLNRRDALAAVGLAE